MTLTTYAPSKEEQEAGQFDKDGTVSLPNAISSLDFPYWVIQYEPSGIKWTWQVGGFACLHPVCSGVLLKPDKEMAKVLEAVEKYIFNKYGGYCVPENHFFVEDGSGKVLTEEDASYCDRLLENCTSHKLVIDRTRLKDSCEAWVYALMDGKPCVLTGLNSD